MTINVSVLNAIGLVRANNLLQLALYLLRQKPTNFDMKQYCTLPSGGTLFYVPDHKQCGTVGCAVGHGPDAGIPSLPGESWRAYCQRQLLPIEQHSAWLWCFSDTWASVDNTPAGAALRILYYLRNNHPLVTVNLKQWRELPVEGLQDLRQVYTREVDSLQAWIAELESHANSVEKAMYTDLPLLIKWRQHIRDVYERRGRLDIYVPLEVFHTCHGCGAGGGGVMTGGLCETCNKQYEAIVNKT